MRHRSKTIVSYKGVRPIIFVVSSVALAFRLLSLVQDSRLVQEKTHGTSERCYVSTATDQK